MSTVKNLTINGVPYPFDVNVAESVVAAREATQAANAAAEVALTAASRAPQIGDNGNWYVWDSTAAEGEGAYVDTNIPADPETTKANKTYVDDSNLVIAEAIAALRRDIDGIQQFLATNAGDLKVKSLDVEGSFYRFGQKIFDLVDSAPTEIPKSVGLVRFNPSNGALYISKSVTNSTSDWVRVL